MGEEDRPVLEGYTGWLGLSPAFDAHEGISEDAEALAAAPHMERLRALIPNTLWVRIEHLAESPPPEGAEWADVASDILAAMPEGTVGINMPGDGPRATMDPFQAEVGRLLRAEGESPVALDAANVAESMPNFAGAFLPDAPALPTEGGMRHVPWRYDTLLRAVNALPPGGECLALVDRDEFLAPKSLSFRTELAKIADWNGGDEKMSAMQGNDMGAVLAVPLKRRSAPHRNPCASPLAPEKGVKERLDWYVLARGESERQSFAAAVTKFAPHPLAEDPDAGGVPMVRAALSEAERRCLESLKALGAQARALLRMEAEDFPAATIAEVRDRLREAVEGHLGAHGRGRGINTPKNSRLLGSHPDRHLILSLQGIEMGVEVRSPLLERRLLFPPPPLPERMGVEEAADRSMTERGGIDLWWCANRTGLSVRGFCREAIRAGACHRTPEGGLLHRDEFLSGDIPKRMAEVQRELEAAEAGKGPRDRFRAEAARASLEALDHCLPPRIPFESIMIEFGGRWIPDRIYGDFVAHLLRLDPQRGAVRIERFDGDCVIHWAHANTAEAGPLNRVDYGTKRISAVEIMENCLAGRDVVVHKTKHVMVNGERRKKRSIDRPATVSARERRDRILDEFRDWVGRSPQRRKALEDRYNDLHSRHRHREHRGDGLRLAGASGEVELRWNQRRAAARILSERRTLLDHVVGAGKTFAALSGIRCAQDAGVSRKAMITVPNHLLSQWGRDAHVLYPEARVLSVLPADLTPKAISGTLRRMGDDWDMVIFPHSGLTKLSRMSQPLSHFGFDTLCVDESHLFKSLSLPHFNRRITGVRLKGSKVADWLLEQVRMMDKHHPHGRIVFATGTPIANSLAEMWAIQSYLDPEGLERRGEENFSDWLSNYGEVKDEIEIDDTGTGLISRTRLRRFRNIPEIANAYRKFADVCLAADMDRKQTEQWDIPPIAGGKPEMRIVKSNSALQERMEHLSERMRRIKGVEEEAPPAGPPPPAADDEPEDNVLKVLGDGRKLALSVRLWDRNVQVAENEEEKLRVAAGRIAELWRRWEGQQGLQLVFCDLSVPKSRVPDEEFLRTDASPFDDPTRPYDVYNDLKLEICRQGVPPEQVAFIHDAATPARREALFEQCRDGRVRVLVGSTAKMGTGVNVQERLTAVHHLDAPWRPADMEQRDGRILRPGNRILKENEGFQVEIIRYASERTTDAKVWQALETKQRMLDDLRRGKPLDRSMEDLSSEVALGYEEIKALAAGSQATYDLMLERKEFARLTKNEAEHDSRIAEHGKRVTQIEGLLEQLNERKAALQRDAEAFMAPSADGRAACIAALEAVETGASPEMESDRGRRWDLGRVCGLSAKLADAPSYDQSGNEIKGKRNITLWLEGEEVRAVSPFSPDSVADAIRFGTQAVKSLEAAAAGINFDEERASLDGRVKGAKRERRHSRREALRPFPLAAEREECLARIRALETAIANELEESRPTRQRETLADPDDPENAADAPQMAVGM